MARGGGHKRGVPLSAAAKKISDALRGRKHPHKGHAESADTRAKISKAEKGKKHPHRGHPMTTATRAKLSEAAKKRATARGGGTQRGATSTRHPGTGRTTSSAGQRGPVLHGAARTPKFRAGSHRLIMAGTRHSRASLIHGVRHRRSRIVIHHIKTHRVWRKRKR